MTATAQGARPTIKLDIDPCVEAERADVERILGIELDTLAAGKGRAAGAFEVPVNLACLGDLTVVRVVDPITEKTLERPVRLRRAAASARSRLLALAIVELLVASWAELGAEGLGNDDTGDESRIAPAPEARQAAQEIAAARRPEIARPASLRLFLVGGGDHFFSRIGTAGSAGVKLGADPGRFLGWAGDLRLGRAVAGTTSGDVVFESLSVAPVLLARVRAGQLAFRGGGGLRAGLGRLTGIPAYPDRQFGHSFAAPWAGGLVTAGVEWSPAARLLVELTVESGYALVPLRGRVLGKPEVVVGGPWLGASLAVGWLM